MVERYRTWFEQEKASTVKMLAMIDSVPLDKRADPRYDQALRLAGHLAACRENWLDRMIDGGTHQVTWWPRSAKCENLRKRFARLEARWTAYLATLTDDVLDVDFEFPVTGGSYRWNIEGQVMQLVGHAFYHRGQIALLVDQLGGKSVDTDFLFWAIEQHPDRWRRLG